MEQIICIFLKYTPTKNQNMFAVDLISIRQSGSNFSLLSTCRLRPAEAITVWAGEKSKNYQSIKIQRKYCSITKVSKPEII